MKLSKRLRLFFSLTSLLMCVSFASVAVNADSVDMSLEETVTSESDTETYADGKMTLTDAQQIIENDANIIAQIAMSEFTAEDAKYFAEKYAIQNGFDPELFTAYAGIAGNDGTGAYKSHGDVTVTETDEDNVVTVSTVLSFEKKDAEYTITVQVFETIGPQPIARSITLAGEGEETIMDKLASAGLNTIVGMGTVFVVLIFISLIISCFTFIPKIQAMFSKKKEETAVEEKTVAEIPVPEAVVVDDTQLIAVIAAAIAASENTTTDGFVVRSIRRR